MKTRQNLLNDIYIIDLYKSFKVFVNNYNLPNFKICYTNNNRYHAQLLVYQNPIILNVNIDSLNHNQFKSILIHEFTHLYDYSLILPYYQNNDIKYMMKFYSEFHAYQIQTLYKYKILKNLNDDFNIQNVKCSHKNILMFYKTKYV